MSHGSFRDKHGLRCSSWRTPMEMCARVMEFCMRKSSKAEEVGVLRSTFIIDRTGVVRHALYGVNPRGHAAEVLNLVKGLI